MTEDEKYEIAVLAEDYASKQMIFDCLGMKNAHGLPAEESAKLNIQYHLADAERLEALGRLERAKMKVALPPASATRQG